MFAIGASLREARIKRGLSPADVQRAIRIRDRYLQALEEERWELLPGEVYVKGFLRTYADFLDLDANLYLDEYNSRFAEHRDQPLQPLPLGRPEPTPPRSRRPRWALVAAVAVLAIVAAILGWQLSRPSASPQPPPTTSGTNSGTTTTHKPPKKPPKRPVTALPKRAALVAARGDVWLELRSGGASGPIIYENTLAQGQTLPVQLAGGPVWIDMGAPWNLDVRLGGKLVSGLPTQVGSVLLTRRGLRPA